MSENAKAALAAAGAYEEKIVRFLREMIAIPAESLNEGERAQRILKEYESLDFDEAYFDRLGNVVARVGSGPLKILFDGHFALIHLGIHIRQIDRRLLVHLAQGSTGKIDHLLDQGRKGQDIPVQSFEISIKRLRHERPSCILSFSYKPTADWANEPAPRTSLESGSPPHERSGSNRTALPAWCVRP